MPDLPAHASPAVLPSHQSQPPPTLNIADDNEHANPPPTLVSPAFTPPSTPGSDTPALERDAKCVAVDSPSSLPVPRLVETLPEVNCLVRARIPTTIQGQEMFLHLYQNNLDNKEHLAIVFGPKIRSKSLDAARPGESEMDRMIRGAYTGRLYPGRTSSQLERPTSKASPLLKSLHKSPSVARAPDNRVPHVPANPSMLHTGPATASQNPLVRIHSECYTGETVWSARCDCGEQLDEAARLMSLPSASESGGVIIYLRQEGRGIGLGEKLKAYNLQDLGSDTVEANLLLRHPADARSYGLATSMLCDLGLGTDVNALAGIRLLTNNPEKIRAVEGPNREIVVKERVAMIPLAWQSGGATGVQGEEVGRYLQTKVRSKALHSSYSMLIFPDHTNGAHDIFDLIVVFFHPQWLRYSSADTRQLLFVELQYPRSS